MKTEDMMILAAAVGGALLIVKSVKANNAGGATAKPLSKWVSEIFDVGGGSYGNGWRYFDDGTAIAPNGDYYLNGQLVWKSPASLSV